MEPLRNAAARLPGGQMIGPSKDVCGTSVKYDFNIQLTNTLNLL